MLSKFYRTASQCLQGSVGDSLDYLQGNGCQSNIRFLLPFITGGKADGEAAPDGKAAPTPSGPDGASSVEGSETFCHAAPSVTLIDRERECPMKSPAMHDMADNSLIQPELDCCCGLRPALDPDQPEGMTSLFEGSGAREWFAHGFFSYVRVEPFPTLISRQR